MSELLFKEKYFKYKSKYLKYKNQLNISQNGGNNLQDSNNLQDGGNYYLQGDYIFFLTQDQVNKNQSIIDNKIIHNFDKFTTDLGNCALFLRIGKTFTGFDTLHTYDSVYPNNSTLDVANKTLKDTTNATISAANTAINTTKDVMQKTGTVVSSAANTAINTTKDVMQKTGTVVNSAITSAKTAYNNSTVHKGGENDGIHNCNYSRIYVGNYIKFISDAEPTKIENVVKKINIKDDPNKIVYAIVINKKGNVTTDAEIVKKFTIGLDDKVNLVP
jgi:hypothetical protein